MPPIPTLLLTGQNNHDWARSAPFLRDLLSGSGRFEITLTEDASATLEGDISGYELLFLDYNGPAWSAAAQSNFLRRVEAGAGVVIYHAANNAFTGWVEYEKMVGLLWREGTGHGKFHVFDVAIQDREHPITRGVENFSTHDELYHRLVPLHGTPVHVLATAYSAPGQDGTGNHEPVLMTSRYGQGRVFHTALGHLWKGDPNGEYRGASLVALENPGFQTTLLRGAEWAARGEVA